MKKTLLVGMMLCMFITYAQKEKNGNIYMEHPAIEVVQEFTEAAVKGDTTKMASYLTDDFKGYNGTSNITDDKGIDKAAFLRNQMLYFDQLDYFSATPFPGSYPDAIEYKKDNEDDEVWVQTWTQLNGVHKTTGVKIDAAAHRLYALTKDNKIKTIITYSNGSVMDEIRSSFTDRTNGTIYNHHDNINTVRKMIYAVENNDLEKAYSFYDEGARFSDLSTISGNGISLSEQKELDKQILDQYEITSIDMNGYPDYLHYEMGDARVVQSWWTINLMRKADKKAIALPILFIHDFNEEGKIIHEAAYYNEKLLEQPSKVAN